MILTEDQQFIIDSLQLMENEINMQIANYIRIKYNDLLASPRFNYLLFQAKENEILVNHEKTDNKIKIEISINLKSKL